MWNAIEVDISVASIASLKHQALQTFPPLSRYWCWPPWSRIDKDVRRIASCDRQIVQLVQDRVVLVMALHRVAKKGLGGVDEGEKSKTIPGKAQCTQKLSVQRLLTSHWSYPDPRQQDPPCRRQGRQQVRWTSSCWSPWSPEVWALFEDPAQLFCRRSVADQTTCCFCKW